VSLAPGVRAPRDPSMERLSRDRRPRPWSVEHERARAPAPRWPPEEHRPRKSPRALGFDHQPPTPGPDDPTHTPITGPGRPLRPRVPSKARRAPGPLSRTHQPRTTTSPTGPRHTARQSTPPPPPLPRALPAPPPYEFATGAYRHETWCPPRARQRHAISRPHPGATRAAGPRATHRPAAHTVHRLRVRLRRRRHPAPAPCRDFVRPGPRSRPRAQAHGRPRAARTRLAASTTCGRAHPRVHPNGIRAVVTWAGQTTPARRRAPHTRRTSHALRHRCGTRRSHGSRPHRGRADPSSRERPRWRHSHHATPRRYPSSQHVPAPPPRLATVRDPQTRAAPPGTTRLDVPGVPPRRRPNPSRAHGLLPATPPAAPAHNCHTRHTQSSHTPPVTLGASGSTRRIQPAGVPTPRGPWQATRSRTTVLVGTIPKTR
jgi:hypothetical protein